MLETCFDIDFDLLHNPLRLDMSRRSEIHVWDSQFLPQLLQEQTLQEGRSLQESELKMKNLEESFAIQLRSDRTGSLI